MEREDRSAPPQEILDVNGHPLIVGEFYYIMKKNRRRDDKVIERLGTNDYIRFRSTGPRERPTMLSTLKSDKELARYLGKSETSKELIFVKYIPADKEYFTIKAKDFIRYKRGVSNTSHENKFVAKLAELSSLTSKLEKSAYDENGIYDFRKQNIYTRGELELNEDGSPYRSPTIGDFYEEFLNDSIYEPVIKVEDDIEFFNENYGIENPYLHTAHGKTKKRTKHKKRRTKHKKRRN